MLRSLCTPLASGMRTHMMRPIAAMPAASAAASSIVAASSSPFSFTPIRSLVVDRASRRVGRIRRNRRELLRVLAHRTRGSENESRRMAVQAPPLAGMDSSAANLHQFVSFLARQYSERLKEGESKEAASLRETREGAAAPAWSMRFEDLSELMSIPRNHTFRACEEILGALSDPTTELGFRGLTSPQFIEVMNYVNESMRQSTVRLSKRMAFAGDFQHMDVDDQYELAGAYAVRYLTAQLQKKQADVDKILYEARANKILVPDNTPLGKAMPSE